MKKNVNLTIKDVARYCGVSVSTVSKCLNGYTDISEETIQKVSNAVEILNFSPSNAARMMTKKNTHLIGLTIPDIMDPFFSENASAAEKFLEENGYQMFYGNMQRSEAKTVHFLHQAREMRFDGLIITPDAWTAQLLDALSKLNIPTVALRRRPPQSTGIPYVDNDHYKGAIQMMSYLTDLGHSGIAHIALSTSIGNLRKEAYLEFCAIRGIEPRLFDIDMPAHRLPEGREIGYEAMRRIYSRYPDTTAVFAGTDELAVGALIFLKEAGIAVPDQISVAGIGDVDYSSLPWIDLTTMQLNKVEMGRVAAQLLLHMIDGVDPHPENILLGSSLIVRGSTKEIQTKSKEKV